jgi:prepilin-type processing-associated H-X9-DG protein
MVRATAGSESQKRWGEVLLPYMNVPFAPLPGTPSYVPSGDARDRYLAALYSEVTAYQCIAMPQAPYTMVGVTHPLRGGKVVIRSSPQDWVINGFDLTGKTQNEQFFTARYDVLSIPGVESMVYVTEAHQLTSWTYFVTHDIWRNDQLWFGAVPRMSTDTRHGDAVPSAYFDGHAASPTMQSMQLETFHMKP